MEHPPQWPPGTIIEAIENIPLDDYGHGNSKPPLLKQTVILKGARGAVGYRVHLDKVLHWCGSTIYDTPYLWKYRASFRVVEL